MFDNKGQSALEYLMTYGWALIVIAIVIGVLIFVTSGATGGVTCQSSSTGMVVKNWTVSSTAGVGLSIQNTTGSDINVTAVSATGTFETGTPLVNGAAIASGVAITKNNTFSVTGPTATAGNTSASVVTISYRIGTGTSALPATGTITCSGTVA
ncbi:MAG: hypothetical protein WCI04_02830 [archaeon]